MIAYWLLPTAEASEKIAALIRELAAEFDAPIFDPHVTLYAGGDDVRIAEQTVSTTGERSAPIILCARSIEHSDRFTKTLFIQLLPDNELKGLSAFVQSQACAAEPYELNPHVSLLYARVTAAVREKTTQQIAIPSAAITFDRIRAVRCAIPIKTRTDVEGWQTLAEAKLIAGAGS